MCSVTLQSSADDEKVTSPQEVDPHYTHLARTFVPTTARRSTEQKTIRQSVQAQQFDHPPAAAPPTVLWPPTSGTPINEFNTEGYITCAFPTLFPTGAADFVAPRPHSVTIGNYVKHLMIYEDGRFARHPCFRYFALNTEIRWRALQTGRIYVRQQPHDAQLSVEKLRDMVGSEGRSLFKSCSTLCCQSTWDETVLVSTAESAHCHGRHPWSTYSVLHTQCS